MLATSAVAALLVAVQPRLRAQTTAPGGVAPGLIAWQKADAAGVSSGASWIDSSGTGHTASGGPGATQPTFHDGSTSRAMNFNPAFDFDGDAYFVYGDPLGVFGAESFSSAVVLRRDDPRTEIFFGSNQGNPTFTAHLATTGAVGAGVSGSSSNGTCGYGTSTTLPVGVPGIGSHVRNGTTGITGQLNGGGTGTGPCTTTNFAASGRVLGRRFLTNQNAYPYVGSMAEFIQYTRALTADELHRIHSYLAIKYGITLDQTTPTNYIDATGAVVWDATVNATYRNNIAGVGRDDASGLIQRQSQSVNLANTGNLVTMGLSTIATSNATNANNFAADRNFLIWGDDGASTSFATPIVTPSVGTSTRMTRVWRVQETGTVATAKVALPATIAPNALLYLVVSSDATFDNTDQWIPMTSFTAGSVSYVAGDFNFANGQYFTFAAVPLTDLLITKSDGQLSYLPGQPISYSIVVANAGPSNATGVSIADAVPAAMTGVTVNCVTSGTGACGTNGSSGNNVSLTGASIAAGAGNQLTITVSGTVNPSATGPLTNTATVSAGAGQSDPDTSNNAATDTDVPSQADVVITKNGPASATAGQTLTYTLTITNNGPDLATTVSVSDPTPSGLTFVSNTGDCTTAFPCALGDLPSGATRTITATYQVPSSYTSPSPIVNTATVTNLTSDPNPANNTSSASAPLTPPQSDLQIVKNVSGAAVLPGQNFTYTLQIKNNGPSQAANVVVTDALPAQTTFVSSAAGCTAVGQNVTCPTIATMAVGATATFGLTVQLNPAYVGDGSDILNSGHVTSATADPALQNNTNPVGAPPVGPPGADVAIVKTVSSAPVSPGDTFTYSLLVSNQGPSTATNVVITDTLPAGVTFVSSAQGCTAAGQDVTCPPIATFNPGDSTTFTLLVRLDAAYAGDGSDLPNQAVVTSDTPDPVPGNNTSAVVTPNIGSASADLSTMKTVLESSVMPGQTFTYRVTVTNAGPSTAVGVNVTDTLPTQVLFTSSPSGCSAAGQSVTCPPVSLASGTNAIFDIVARLDPNYVGDGSDVLNVASVSATTSDPNVTNNTSAPVRLQVASASADVSITKSVLQSSVVPGQTFTYRIGVSNAGPATATNLAVTDPLPAYVTFVSSPQGCTATLNGGTQQVTCPSIASLTVGGSTTIDIVAKLDPSYVGSGSDIVNVASVLGTTADAAPANNSSAPVALTVAPPSADLTTAKTTFEPSVTPGGTFTYRIAVTNHGPSTATNVRATDPLPAGLTFDSSIAGCTAAGQTVTCGPVASVLPGAAATFEFVVRLDPAYTGNGSDLLNVATPTSDVTDPDPTNDPNPPTPPPPVDPPQSDVQIVKNVSGDLVLPGQTFSYTLQVTNNGPSVATNVVATDPLPAQVAFVSSASGCTASGQLVTCPAVPTLNVGQTVTFTIVTQLDAAYTGDGSDVLNSAHVTSTTLDPALQNNTSPAGAPPVGPPGADVAIVKTVSAGSVAPGETFSYSLLVSNQGPSVATNVVASDALPAGITFVSSGDSCSAALDGSTETVTCPAIATLNPGGFTTFTFVVQLDPGYTGDGSDLPNRGVVTADTDDPVPANNISAPVTPNVGTASADLSTTKVAIGNAVSPGMLFTYRISVANAGPSAAQNVSVTDNLPASLTFVSSPQACSAAGQTVTCTQASVAPGATATFDLLVRLDPAYVGDGSDLANIATATSPTLDPDPTNNVSDPAPAPPIGSGEADLTITKTGPYGPVPAGGEITYTLVVTNQGPNAAIDATVQDPTPAGLTLIETSGDCTTGFPCALGTLVPGQAKTITARYTVAANANSVIVNTATVTSSTPDPSATNSTATAQTPPAAVTYYLAEGATGTFWDEDVLIANPNDQAAPVTMRFFKESGEVIIKTLTVAAKSHMAVRVDDIPGLEATTSSAQVVSETGLPLAVQRTMTWDARGYGGHSESAVTEPSTSWYFAEGAQGWFDTFVLVENPGDTATDVTMTFLREGETPVVKVLPLGAHARLTVQTATIPELATRSFGIVVTATQPIVAERSMYFGTTADRLWSGGHASAGVPQPSQRWFYAEGATGSFFDTFILLSNPQMVDAHVTLEYILPDGTLIPVTKVVPAQRRLTVRIDDEADPRLQATSVSTRILADVPIVTERSMYWDTKPDVYPWSEGHNSFGVDQTAPRWAIADGRTGGAQRHHGYILLSNPWSTAAEVTVTYVRDNGAAPIVKTYTVAPTTRYTIDVTSAVPELQDEAFGARVEVTNGLTISVEQSLYWSGDGVFWVAGTNAAGTRLP